jgi:prepilin-type processing-associated H-X9-DG protein
VVSPALPNEGVWQTLAKVHGLPAMRAAYLRPDTRHTSYTSAIVRMDQHLLSTIYHPGTDQPGGGPWKLPSDLSGPRRVNLLAAYNSAFRLGDANGGFYNEGRTVAPLRPGAASMVLYADGHVDVGSWGSEVSMSSGVVSLRQNLLLIVDGGQVVPTINDNTGQRWGKTISYKAYVWRTGVGIAANGDVVFAAGNSLSAATLAELLRRGGAVRAMELDINPAWTTFNLYNAAASPQTNERKLLPDMQPSVARYDMPSSRDFYAVYARP